MLAARVQEPHRSCTASLKFTTHTVVTDVMASAVMPSGFAAPIMGQLLQQQHRGTTNKTPAHHVAAVESACGSLADVADAVLPSADTNKVLVSHENGQGVLVVGSPPCRKVLQAALNSLIRSTDSTDVLERLMLQVHAAAVATGCVSPDGVVLSKTIPCTFVDGRDPWKLLIASRLRDADTAHGTCWTLAQSARIFEGLLPWRLHAWHLNQSTVTADNVVESHAVDMHAVEFVATRSKLSTTRLEPTVCLDGADSALNGLFSNNARVWYFPHNGTWWRSLRTAIKHMQVSRTTRAKMVDPTFAPFMMERGADHAEEKKEEAHQHLRHRRRRAASLMA